MYILRQGKKLAANPDMQASDLKLLGNINLTPFFFFSVCGGGRGGKTVLEFELMASLESYPQPLT
jgi:hypothetical protein